MSAQISVYNAQGLTNEEMRRHCPAIFAEDKHQSRSNGYSYVSTVQLLQAIREKGFIPTLAMQSRSRVEGKTEFTKHLIRFRSISDLGYAKPDVREIVMVNAHDGTSSYQLMQGVFRCVCSNGLITGDIDQTFRIPHKSNIIGKVVEGTLRIIEETEETMADIERMKQIRLEPKFQFLLAEFAMSVRFGLETPDEGDDMPQGRIVDALPSPTSSSATHATKTVVYQPADFLRVRHPEDVGDNSLYVVANTVQENIIKGGVRRYSDGEKHTTRAVKGIDQNIRVNRAIWQFSKRMMEMLG